MSLASTIFLLSILVYLSTFLLTTAQSVYPVMQYAYVANGHDNNVSIINSNTNKVIATVPVGKTPLLCVVGGSQHGSKIYVANYGKDTVSVIDTLTNLVTTTLKVGNNPSGIAANPYRSQIYVANSQDNNIYVIHNNRPSPLR